MKKKVIIGIIIAVVVLLIGILTYGEVTGKFSLFGRKTRSGTTTFCALSYASYSVAERTDQGVIAGDVEWKSVSYSFDTQQTITITRYRNVDLDVIINAREGYSEEEHSGLDFLYMTTHLDEEPFMLVQYYTQIGNNTYYISSVHKESDENNHRLYGLLDGISVGTEPEDEIITTNDPENP